MTSLPYNSSIVYNLINYHLILYTSLRHLTILFNVFKFERKKTRTFHLFTEIKQK